MDGHEKPTSSVCELKTAEHVDRGADLDQDAHCLAKHSKIRTKDGDRTHWWCQLGKYCSSGSTCSFTCSNDDRVEQGSCVSRPNTVEQHWSVENDGIDACELLEHHEHEGDDQLGAVLALEQVPHGVGGQVADASSLCHVLQLFFDITCSTNASQHLQEKTTSLLSQPSHSAFQPTTQPTTLLTTLLSIQLLSHCLCENLISSVAQATKYDSSEYNASTSSTVHVEPAAQTAIHS